MVREHVLLWWSAKAFLRRGHLRRLDHEDAHRKGERKSTRQREQQRSLLCFKVRVKVTVAERE